MSETVADPDEGRVRAGREAGVRAWRSQRCEAIRFDRQNSRGAIDGGDGLGPGEFSQAVLMGVSYLGPGEFLDRVLMGVRIGSVQGSHRVEFLARVSANAQRVRLRRSGSAASIGDMKAKFTPPKYEVIDGQTAKVGRYTVKVEQDADAQNPYDNMDTLASVVHVKGRGWFGKGNATEVSRYDLFEAFTNDMGRRATADFASIELDTYTDNNDGTGFSWVFFDFSDVSGIRLDTVNRPIYTREEIENFDGYAYLSPADIKKGWGEGGLKKHWKNAAAVIRGELETMGAYLAGEVYLYTIEDERGSVDDVGGMYEYSGAYLRGGMAWDSLPYVWQEAIQQAAWYEADAKAEDAKATQEAAEVAEAEGEVF